MGNGIKIQSVDENPPEPKSGRAGITKRRAPGKVVIVGALFGEVNSKISPEIASKKQSSTLAGAVFWSILFLAMH